MDNDNKLLATKEEYRKEIAECNDAIDAHKLGLPFLCGTDLANSSIRSIKNHRKNCIQKLTILNEN